MSAREAADRRPLTGGRGESGVDRPQIDTPVNAQPMSKGRQEKKRKRDCSRLFGLEQVAEIGTKLKTSPQAVSTQELVSFLEPKCLAIAIRDMFFSFPATGERTSHIIPLETRTGHRSAGEHTLLSIVGYLLPVLASAVERYTPHDRMRIEKLLLGTAETCKIFESVSVAKLQVNQDLKITKQSRKIIESDERFAILASWAKKSTAILPTFVELSSIAEAVVEQTRNRLNLPIDVRQNKHEYLFENCP